MYMNLQLSKPTFFAFAFIVIVIFAGRDISSHAFTNTYYVAANPSFMLDDDILGVPRPVGAGLEISAVEF